MNPSEEFRTIPRHSLVALATSSSTLKEMLAVAKGQIKQSQRCPVPKTAGPVPLTDAVRRPAAVPMNDNLRSIWQAKLKDVKEGYTVGPLSNEDDVKSSSSLVPRNGSLHRDLKLFKRTKFVDVTVLPPT